MTYCVGIKTHAGLVFLSDSRTSAGMDSIASFRKALVYEQPGERFMTLLSAGNLSISQCVREILQSEKLPAEDGGEPLTIWNASSMYDAARVLGEAIRRVRARDGAALAQDNIEFNASFIFGGQIKGEPMRLFLVYAAGNFIEATCETPFFQIGESKYGKPVLDRVITPDTPLDEAAKCALVSMDSTLKSNLSVGLPLDLVIYASDALRSEKIVCIDEHNAYWQMLRADWGARLRTVFDGIEDPVWDAAAKNVATPLMVPAKGHAALRKIVGPEDPSS